MKKPLTIGLRSNLLNLFRPVNLAELSLDYFRRTFYDLSDF
ncbi:MAG: hypothetical protein N3G78_10000 [Desulfobacterota bacterium]|nr:hypothetical protein [Thermodesulfobacteriota bacterium]